jgi:hypothetical protein
MTRRTNVASEQQRTRSFVLRKPLPSGEGLFHVGQPSSHVGQNVSLHSILTGNSSFFTETPATLFGIAHVFFDPSARGLPKNFGGLVGI